MCLQEHADGELLPGTPVILCDHEGNSMRGTVRELTTGRTGAPLALVDVELDTWPTGATMSEDFPGEEFSDG